MAEQSTSPASRRGLFNLAGIAGLLVAPCILTFAFVGEATGLSFFFGVLSGESIEPWVEAVRASDSAWRIVMVGIASGFASMLVSAIAILRLLPRERWQKYVSLAGYAAGIPVAISACAAQASLMFQLRLSSEPVPAALLEMAEVGMLQFLLVSKFYGPVLVVVLGSGGLSWCLFRDGMVPRWVALLGLACAVMAFLQLFSLMIPALAVFGLGAGPLHMLWFSILGGSLLLRRPA